MLIFFLLSLWAKVAHNPLGSSAVGVNAFVIRRYLGWPLEKPMSVLGIIVSAGPGMLVSRPSVTDLIGNLNFA